MKEVLEILVYKPKKAEKIAVQTLKLLFTFSYTVLLYKLVGITSIVEEFISYDKLKVFIFSGNILLFLMVFYVLYEVFFYYLTGVFSLIGTVSYWIFIVTFFVTLNLLALFFSIIFLFFMQGFKYKPFYKLNMEDGFYEHYSKFFKSFLARKRLLKSKEQRLRSSKELTELMKEIRKVMIDEPKSAFNNLFTNFMFISLWTCYYFIYIKGFYGLPEYVDKIMFVVFLIIGGFQLFLYWIYRNYRVVYKLYLLIYRKTHQREILEKEVSELVKDLERNLTNAIEESINNPISNQLKLFEE
jgi:hypothetical protein